MDITPQGTPSRLQLARIVLSMSIPAILAEVSSVMMQYIDAAMVGSLGEAASASIGLVESATWLAGGLCTGTSIGFTVQVAQLIGAGRHDRARNVLRQALVVLTAFSLALGALCALLSGPLPGWLGGDPEILHDATMYFLVFACSIPAIQMLRLATGMLQCSGDMRTPSALNILACALDVAFNWLLIFPTHHVSVGGLAFDIPGANLGVLGAALGTAASNAITAALLLMATCRRNPYLRLDRGGSWRLERPCVLTAARMAAPVCLERVLMSGAQIASTGIVAPLGTTSLAAHSLAITAESLAYNPSYGIGTAATALVGQSLGAGRRDLARSYARASVALGMAIMALMGVLLYVFAPWAMALLTPVAAVQALGARVLRIEAFAEPLFGANIVVAGALRGAGDTLVPSIMNLACMWGLRITSAALLAPRLGLVGVWAAMAVELCVRGTLFLVRLLRERWLEKATVTE